MPDSAHDERFLASSVVAVVAHPDDETIGLSVMLARFARQCTVIHVTDGAPKGLEDARAAGFATAEEYARQRRSEVLASLALVGVNPAQCLELGVADQGATANLVPLTQALHGHFRQLQPKFVFTHAYEGGHPDHDALALAVPMAAELVRRDGGMPPAVLEFAGYHAGPGGSIRTMEFLPGNEAGETVVTLSEGERERKRAMFDCFTSQQAILRQFPIGVERHRPAPAYDFARPPHGGRLYYEHFSWGMDGDEWRERARLALRELTE